MNTTTIPSNLVTSQSMAGTNALLEQMMIALMGVMVVVFFILLIGVAWRVCSTVGFWFVYKKAGEKGWKAIIPFYSEYICFKLFWSKKLFWGWLVANIIALVLGFAAGTQAILTVIASIASVVNAVFLVMLYYRISKCFGHGVGYLFGLVFAVPVFAMILGFEKSKYDKNQRSFGVGGKKKAAPKSKAAPKKAAPKAAAKPAPKATAKKETK